MTDVTGSTTHNSTDENVHDAAGRHRPRYDDVNVPVVVMIGFISAVVTFLTIAFVQGLYFHWSAAFVNNTPNPAVVENIAAQKAVLNANPETRRLSIEEAMSFVANKYAQAGVVENEGEDGHGSEANGEHADPTHDVEQPAEHEDGSHAESDNEG